MRTGSVESGNRAWSRTRSKDVETAELKTTKKSTSIGRTELLNGIKSATEGGSTPEALINYLESGNHSLLETSTISGALGKLFSGKNEEALKKVFGIGHYKYALEKDFAQDDKERQLTKSLIAFVTAEDEKSRAQEFNENLAQLFMSSSGRMLPESDAINDLEKNKGLSPLVSAAKAMGLYTLVNQTVEQVNKGENPAFIERGVYEDLIAFDMRAIENKFDPDSGAIMKDGETLVPALRADDKDIAAMNIDSSDPNAPIKEGQSINWYNFIREARTLGMGEDKQKFIDHIQNTLAVANGIIRNRIADAKAMGAAGAREVERYQTYQKNLLKVFRDGYNSTPKAMVKLVEAAFTEAPAGTKVVRTILSGKAEEIIQNNTINEQATLITEDVKNGDEPGFGKISDTAKDDIAGTDFITTLHTNENDVSIGTFNNSTGKVTFSSSRLATNNDANNDDKVTYTQVGKKYSKLTKDIAAKFRKDFAGSFFGKAGANLENIPEFRKDNKKTIREITDNYRTKGTSTSYTNDTQALNAIRDGLADRVLEGVTKGVYSDKDNTEVTKIVEELVFSLAKSAIKNGSELDTKEKNALRKYLTNEMNALKVSINARNLSDVAGVDDAAKQKAVKDSVINLVNKIRTAEFKGSKKGLIAIPNNSLDANAVTIRDKALFDELVKKGKAEGLLSQITADENSKDDFSKIKVDAIDGLIEDIDSLKTTLLENHGFDDVTKIKDLKGRRLEGDSLLAALYATKDEVSSEATRNSTKLAAFLELVKEAKLTDKERDLVVNKLFSTRLGALEDGSKTSERNALGTALDRIIDTDYSTVFTIDVAGNVVSLVSLQGTNIIRSNAASSIGSLVTQRAGSTAVSRIGALVSSFAPNVKLTDMAGELEAGATHLNDVLEKGFDNIDDLNKALSQMPAEAQRAYNRYTQQSEISPLTEDKADSLEPHNATSVLEDIAGFFKGLMQKFKLIRQSSDSNVNDNSSGKSETKES
jgi:uncharacterized protein YicC (UPF0701 family)